jgi:hypothetical protein
VRIFKIGTVRFMIEICKFTCKLTIKIDKIEEMNFKKGGSRLSFPLSKRDRGFLS